MKVLISGANGLIGGTVRSLLEARGDQVIALSRTSLGKGHTIAWQEGCLLSPRKLEGFDAVIHLAGESVAGRWTEEKKKAIYDSRIKRTKKLSAALAETKAPPRAFICASAIGLYGDRGAEELNENSPCGEGFLAKVCRDWEAACHPVSPNTRVSNLRFGIVLSAEGGALKQTLTPFRLGLGGPLGDGLQYWSWISLTDTARAILHVLDNELIGPFNITAPQPVRNAEFTKELANVLKRPAVFRVPAFALRLMMTGFADEALLSSTRAIPRHLQARGFTFEHENLPTALNAILKN